MLGHQQQLQRIKNYKSRTTSSSTNCSHQSMKRRKRGCKLLVPLYFLIPGTQAQGDASTAWMDDALYAELGEQVPEAQCFGPLLQIHAETSEAFYARRQLLWEQAPALFEDVRQSYPEESPVSEMLIHEALAIARLCPKAVAMELFLDVERRLSLLGQASMSSELTDNASLACQRWSLVKRLLGHPEDFGEAALGGEAWQGLESLDWPLKHADASWRRLGLEADSFCGSDWLQAPLELLAGPSLAGQPLCLSLPRLPLPMRDIGIHGSCKLLIGGTGGGRSGGSRQRFWPPGLAQRLPPAARLSFALAASSANGAVGAQTELNNSEECRPTSASWLQKPVARCKYATVAAFLRLGPHDAVLDLHVGPEPDLHEQGCTPAELWLPHEGEPSMSVTGLSVSSQDFFERLENLPPDSFGAILANQNLGPDLDVGMKCLLVSEHLVRLLRPGGGVLWWGGLDGKDAGEWHRCLAPLASLQTLQLSYVLVPELEMFGTTETWSAASLSLIAVRLPREELQESDLSVAAVSLQEPVLAVAANAVSETRRLRNIYGCQAARAVGFKAPPKAANTLTLVSAAARMAGWKADSFLQAEHGFYEDSGGDDDAEFVGAFEPGPSFWSCAQARLRRGAPSSSEAKNLAPGLWAAERFASLAEAEYLWTKAEAWLVQALQDAPDEVAQAISQHPDAWVDDVIVPSGSDGVLDALELRLEEELGLPRWHADPWHILRYEPGYRAHWPHTDCNHPGHDPNNDRLVTVLLWLSPCPDGTDSTSGLCELTEDDEGATSFPRYGVRVRLGSGGLAIYGSYSPGPEGSCMPEAMHFAEALPAVSSRSPKVVLQKWYYARPVEPSSPGTPSAICDPGDQSQCKRFLQARPGVSSSQIQASLSAMEAALASFAPASPDEVAEFLRSQEFVDLESSVQAEADGKSSWTSAVPGHLSTTGHWRAQLVLANMNFLGWQIQPAEFWMRHMALSRLRAALRRCPACDDVLSLTIQILLSGGDAASSVSEAAVEDAESLAAEALASDSDRPGVGQAVLAAEAARLLARQPELAVISELYEVLAYGQRLAAMGVAGGGAAARQAAEKLLSSDRKAEAAL
ncbi:unnamed protein product [Polarella glacialis]|uniref:Uncharacterized protein n=1 Tax=Polarella glacialis TaxID=89957 RepID=A0A813L3Y3_POLGL|nr:unnamed protein product [Polarella glacialis]CAE8720078.1 unnamed protein product [Polarella glacialis]